MAPAESWENASTDFFESFKQYDESGSPQRIQVLKYLVLAYMLMGSDINPFDSQETKPYRENPQIVAMTNLVGAYQRRDIHEAEKILKGGLWERAKAASLLTSAGREQEHDSGRLVHPALHRRRAALAAHAVLD